VHQIFTRAVAHEGDAAGVAIRISLQASVIATQFTAGLTPDTLIQQLDCHEISFVVLSLIAMVKVCAAEILQIGHNQPQDTTRFEDAPALPQERSHLITGDVLQEMRGVDQICSGVFQRQAAKKVGAVHGRAAAGVI